MRIATIQFDPQIGNIAANFSRAEALLMRDEREQLLSEIDLLVLPELAFTGYNYPSLSAIATCLEPTADGPSTRWAIRTARRLKCTVGVGYPEATTDGGDEVGNYNTAFDSKITGAEIGLRAYNSLVFVNYAGEVVAHHRKAHLYYTDEAWAQEGGKGFYAGILPIGNHGRQVKATAGICMDVNPYKFEAPYTAYEFATHAKEARARLVILSCAWLTHATREQIEDDPDEPDMQTINYWLTRFFPLLGPQGAEVEVIVVFANRIGEEGEAPRIGEVRYAGSSAVMGMRRSDQGGMVNVRMWDVLGKGQAGLLIVDTEGPPKYNLKLPLAAIIAEMRPEPGPEP